MNDQGDYIQAGSGSSPPSGPADEGSEASRPAVLPVGPSSSYGADPWLREEGKQASARRGKSVLKTVTLSLSVLILITASVLVLWNGDALRGTPFSGDMFPASPAPGGGKEGIPGYNQGEYAGDYRDYFERYYEEYSAPSGNTIPRAPTAAGVTMSLDTSEAKDLTLQEIYERCIPSVVSITAYLDGERYYWGTGVILTRDGYIITNAHVLEGTSSVTVSAWDDSEYAALLVGSDTQSDLAVLKIDAQGLTPAVFGDSDTLRVGDKVVAIGNPLGEELRGTMTDGIISAINRDIDYEGHTMTLIQTNAALNEGNSGGSLVNMCGQVIGITNMKMSSSFSNIEGLGFAIPTKSMKPIVDSLITEGRVTGRPALGITVGAIPAEAASYYALPEGLYVSGVSEKSDAYRKGIQIGDIITAVNGTPVNATKQINEIKNLLTVGDSLVLTFYRDGESRVVTIVLMDSSEVY